MPSPSILRTATTKITQEIKNTPQKPVFVEKNTTLPRTKVKKISQKKVVGNILNNQHKKRKLEKVFKKQKKQAEKSKSNLEKIFFVKPENTVKMKQKKKKHTPIIIYKNKYLFDCPKGGNYFIDAEKYGNESRYVNHYKNLSRRPNIRSQVVYDSSGWHLIYKVIHPIKKDEQILIDYGPDFKDFRFDQF